MDYIMNNVKQQSTSNSITIGFENCETITIPNEFIHTLNIIKPQINEQHISISWNGQFTQDIQERSATLFFIVIKINEEYKKFLEHQYVEQYNKKPSDLDQLVNHSIKQLKRNDIVYCIINDNNKTIEPKPIYLHWIGDIYENEAISYFHGKNESNKDKLDELLCIISTSLPKDEIADWMDELDYLFSSHEVHYDNQYTLIDQKLSPFIS